MKRIVCMWGILQISQFKYAYNRDCVGFPIELSYWSTRHTHLSCVWFLSSRKTSHMIWYCMLCTLILLFHPVQLICMTILDDDIKTIKMTRHNITQKMSKHGRVFLKQSTKRKPTNIDNDDDTYVFSCMFYFIKLN